MQRSTAQGSPQTINVTPKIKVKGATEMTING